MRKLPFAIAGGTALLAAVAAVLTIGLQPARPGVRPSSSPSVKLGPPVTPYAKAVDAAHDRGLHVWLEADLVKRWVAGKDRFDEGVLMVANLAKRPGVDGVKIADELGYKDGLDTTDKIRGFLHDSAAALRKAAPGKLILVDLLVPELGCAPDHRPPLRWATICAVQLRGQYPQLRLESVDSYLRSGDIDVLDLSTGLLSDKTYSGWGLDMATAQRTAWAEVHQRGWDSQVRLQARKALAHPGRYTDSASETDDELATFVDIPRTEGAHAVDVWTWHQQYQGDMYRLLDPGLVPNVLWDALARRRSAGAVLFTHLSPQSLEVGLDADLAALAQVFTDVFVAAGTG